MKLFRTLVLTTALFTLSQPAFAQSIQVGQLGSAQAYEVGTLDNGNGGLDVNLWQGTNATRAADLISSAPTNTSHPVARRLLRAVLLSGGVPPEGSLQEATKFRKARIGAIIALGDMQAAQAISSRTPDLSGDPKISSDLALLAGDTDKACSIADTVLENRGAAKWARLRAFCHMKRDEVSAGELTADILRNTGYEDPVFFSLLRTLSGGAGKPTLKTITQDPLYTAMLSEAAIDWPGPGRPPAALSARTALSSVATPEARLIAFYNAGDALSDNQIATILNALGLDADNAENLAGGSAFDLASALDAPIPSGTGQLFKIATEGLQADRPKAISALLSRAEGAGAFDRLAMMLTSQIQSLSPEEQVITDLDRFTRAAILRRDIGTLQQFYTLLEDKKTLQARIALTTDALGYGFVGGGLGTDIETRLSGEDKTLDRAKRDTFIAMAMGARPSNHITNTIIKMDAGKGKATPAGELALLSVSAQSGARAETALRAASILNSGRLNDQTLHTLIQALNTSGLTGFAGQVAALDFWTDGSL